MTNQKTHIVRPQEENLINNLKKAIAQPESFPVMFYVWGIGGVGKSTLLDKLEEELCNTDKEKICLAKISFDRFDFNSVDENPLSIMEKLHKEIPQLGLFEKDISKIRQIDPFEKICGDYKKTLNDLGTQPVETNGVVTKEQIDLFKQLSKLGANTFLAGQALLGGLGNPLALFAASTKTNVDQTVDFAIDGAVSALSLKDLLLKHQSTKEEQKLRELIIDPLPKLTQAFVESIVCKAKHTPIVLILDTYEKASADIDIWLRQLFLTNKALKTSKIRLVIAGQDNISKNDNWKELISRAKLVQQSQLELFKKEETTKYLESIGISDKRIIASLHNTTKGFPFHLDLIRQDNQDGESINYTEEIFERLLKRLTDNQKRLIELVACCRWFDKLLIKKLVTHQDLDFQADFDPMFDCFDWLKRFNAVEYIRDSDGKYCLKDVARDAIRKSLYSDDRSKFRAIHSLLREYFEDEANQEVTLNSCESEKYGNLDWIRYTTEAIYHAFFSLRGEDGKHYFLHHFLSSRYFNQTEVALSPIASIMAEAEVANNHLLSHENRKFLENIESISPYFSVVWFMIISQPVSRIKVDETQLTLEDMEQIEDVIKMFLRCVDSLPDGLSKYMGLAGKLSRCNDSQKVEMARNLEIQSKFLKNKIKPEYSSHIFYFVGLIYLGLHRYEEASISFNESINLRPDISEVWNNRGVAKANLEKYEEALVDYDEAIKLKSNLTDAWNNRGIAKNNLERYEEAIADYDEAIKLHPNFPATWSNRGLAKANLGKFEEAIADYDEAIKLKLDLAEAWSNRGIAKANLERYQEAINDCDEAIRLKADLPEAWNNRGVAKANLEKFEEAIADYDQAINLKVDYIDVWNNRGLAKANLERYQEAIIDFDKAIKLKIDFIDAWNNRGLAKANLERYQEAIVDFDKAIKLNPDDNKAFMNTGYIFALLNKYEEALSEYNTAIKLKENCSEAWLQRAIILTRLSKYKEALNDFNKALDIAPDDIRLQVSRGVLFTWIGQHKESIEICDMVLNNNPNNVDALYAKSCCYLTFPVIFLS
jgi:tetratricopeptide (TPR) repeat protein